MKLINLLLTLIFFSKFFKLRERSIRPKSPDFVLEIKAWMVTDSKRLPDECHGNDGDGEYGDSLSSDLNSIVKHTIQYLNDLNQKYETKIDSISADVGNIKNSLQQAEHIENIQQQCNTLNENISEFENIDETNDTPSISPPHLYDNLWIVIQRRQDGSVGFVRTWDDYKKGFGNPFREFFIGLDKIHELTSSRPHELLLQLEDFNGNIKYAKYDEFLVGDETEKYQLKTLGEYSGDAGDYMRDHEKMYFSTKDKDHDANEKLHCAKRFQGGWWYKNCLTSHLNGPFRTRYVISNVGITWGKYDEMQIKTVQMMIRSK